jgi:O-antigen ligase
LAILTNKSQLKTINNFFSIEKITNYLVFLFPIGAASVKSWTSLFTAFLFFTSIAWLYRRLDKRLKLITKEEKWLLWLFFLFFMSFVLAQTINGWEGIKSHWIVIELRYLFFIPIYILLRHMPHASLFFIKGCIVACFVLAVDVVYSVVSFGWGAMVVSGAYHHLYFGSVAGISVLVIIYVDKKYLLSKPWFIASFFAIVLGFGALVMSTARGSYIAIFPLLFVYPFLIKKMKLKYAISIAMIFIVFLMSLYGGSGVVKNRIDLGADELISYFSTERHENTSFNDLGSVGVRFEYWKAALIIFKENPVVGVGRTGYLIETKKLIDAHKISKAVTGTADPHNAFLNIMVEKGGIGLLVFMMIFFASFYLLWRRRKIRENESILGVVFLIAVFIISLTDSASFHRGHFVSFVLFFWVMLISWVNQDKSFNLESCEARRY